MKQTIAEHDPLLKMLDDQDDELIYSVEKPVYPKKVHYDHLPEVHGYASKLKEVAVCKQNNGLANYFMHAHKH